VFSNPLNQSGEAGKEFFMKPIAKKSIMIYATCSLLYPVKGIRRLFFINCWILSRKWRINCYNLISKHNCFDAVPAGMA